VTIVDNIFDSIKEKNNCLKRKFKKIISKEYLCGDYYGLQHTVLKLFSFHSDSQPFGLIG
jgi:hypothetical protein